MDTNNNKEEYLRKLRMLELTKQGMTLSDADKLTPLINAEDRAEIAKQAKTIAADLAQTPNVGKQEKGEPWQPF